MKKASLLLCKTSSLTPSPTSRTLPKTPLLPMLPLSGSSPFCFLQHTDLLYFLLCQKKPCIPLKVLPHLTVSILAEHLKSCDEVRELHLLPWLPASSLNRLSPGHQQLRWSQPPWAAFPQHPQFSSHPPGWIFPVALSGSSHV